MTRAQPNFLSTATALPRRRAKAGLLRPPTLTFPRRVSPNAAFVTQMLVPIIAFIGTDERPARGTVVAGNRSYRQGKWARKKPHAAASTHLRLLPLGFKSGAQHVKLIPPCHHSVSGRAHARLMLVQQRLQLQHRL